MNRPVCIDTNIFIWGMKRQATENREDMIPRSIALLRSLERNHTTVLLPSVVMTELMVTVPKSEIDRFSRMVQEAFTIVAYDYKAALAMHEFWNAENGQEIKEFGKNDKVARDHIKIDMMIVAIAKANNCSHIYSTDHHVMRFANGKIPVSEPPLKYSQADLLPVQDYAMQSMFTNRNNIPSQ